MKVYLDAIGCRLNQSEVETMARQLLVAGHEIVADPALADKVVINTCAVTTEAAKDSRSLTRRIRRNNPGAEIVVTGCYATIAPDELARIGSVSRIVANKDKDRLLQWIDPEVQINTRPYDREPILRDFLAARSSRTRAFVKVQDGCDNRCTFCITTIARGDGKSRHLGDVVAEVQGLAKAGYQEAVLTGVHLGSYGKDLEGDIQLLDLIEAVLEYSDIPRLRLSSLEPWDIPARFFDLWQNQRLLPHLHVPLQSGSDKTLKRMARRTTRSSYREIAKIARERIPFLSLSTDIIAGFPGETEADFDDSLAFVSEIGFSRLHVFTFSSRPGTAAAMMDGQMSKPIKQQRTRRMIDLGKRLGLAFHKRNEGRTLSVLWERVEASDRNSLRWIGYSDNYIRVRAYGPDDLFNRITNTVLTASHPDGMSGDILQTAEDYSPTN